MSVNKVALEALGEDSVGSLDIETMNIADESGSSEPLFAHTAHQKAEPSLEEGQGICFGNFLSDEKEMSLTETQSEYEAVQEQTQPWAENLDGAAAWFKKAKERLKSIFTLAGSQISKLQTSFQKENNDLLQNNSAESVKALTDFQSELQLLQNKISDALGDLDVELDEVIRRSQTHDPSEELTPMATLTTELARLEVIVSMLEREEIKFAKKNESNQQLQLQGTIQENESLLRIKQLETQVEEHHAKYSKLEASFLEVTKKLEIQLKKNETLCNHQVANECPQRQTRSISNSASCVASRTRKRCKSTQPTQPRTETWTQ